MGNEAGREMVNEIKQPNTDAIFEAVKVKGEGDERFVAWDEMSAANENVSEDVNEGLTKLGEYLSAQVKYFDEREKKASPGYDLEASQGKMKYEGAKRCFDRVMEGGEVKEDGYSRLLGEVLRDMYKHEGDRNWEEVHAMGMIGKQNRGAYRKATSIGISRQVLISKMGERLLGEDRMRGIRTGVKWK